MWLELHFQIKNGPGHFYWNRCTPTKEKIKTSKFWSAILCSQLYLDRKNVEKVDSESLSQLKICDIFILKLNGARAFNKYNLVGHLASTVNVKRNKMFGKSLNPKLSRSVKWLTTWRCVPSCLANKHSWWLCEMKFGSYLFLCIQHLLWKCSCCYHARLFIYWLLNHSSLE